MAFSQKTQHLTYAVKYRTASMAMNLWEPFYIPVVSIRKYVLTSCYNSDRKFKSHRLIPNWTKIKQTNFHPAPGLPPSLFPPPASCHKLYRCFFSGLYWEVSGKHFGVPKRSWLGTRAISTVNRVKGPFTSAQDNSTPRDTADLSATPGCCYGYLAVVITSKSKANSRSFLTVWELLPFSQWSLRIPLDFVFLYFCIPVL